MASRTGFLPKRVDYESITDERQLAGLCRRLAACDAVAFDTEFVSEDTYWPQLCLVQIATRDHLAVIDPLKVGSLEPFWRTLADGRQTTIVHAGREELVFSLNSVARPPANLIDVQIAAGLVGHEYPAGYGSLVSKVLSERPPKGETRTDWRRRPLTPHQIEYALADASYLLPLYDALNKRLTDMGRLGWLAEEMDTWQAEVDASRTRTRWRRLSGIASLSGKRLAIARALWHWRDEEAQRRNLPAKHILRDDLVVELARRAVADPGKIMAIRGLERRGLKQHIPELARRVEAALQSPSEEHPRPARPKMPEQLNLLGQVLGSALTSICRSAEVAASLVGTASDVRDLIAYRLDFGDVRQQEEPPRLMCGWRAKVVGDLLEQLLAGNVAMRIADPLSDEPLAFEPTQT